MQRSQWIEQMHRAAPGVNWKAIEQQNRWQNYLLRKQNLQNKGTFNQSGDNPSNGMLDGYWKERGSVNLAGRMVVADYDSVNNLIYCGSAGGIIWKGSITGTNWTPLNDALQFENILMLRVVSNGSNQRLLVATSGPPFFYYSDDGGTTWNAANGLNNVQSWGNLSKGIVLNDAQHTIYLLATEWDWVNNYAQTTIYRSLDLGNNFSALISYGEPTYGSASTFDLWAPRYVNIPCYMLHQQGTQATLYLLNPPSDLPIFISSFPVLSAGTTLLTGFQSDTTSFYAYINQDIYRSINYGNTWSYRSTAPQGSFSRNSFNCSLTDRNTLFIGGIEAFRSNDGGITWNIVNHWGDYYGDPTHKLHADIPCIIPFRISGNYQQFIGTDGGLYLSADALQTVLNISLSGLDVSQYYSTYTDRTDSNYIYAASQDQGFQRCQSDSSSVLGFSQLDGGDYGHIVSANGGNSIWLVYPTFAAYMDNAPTSSSFTATWNFNGSTYYWMPPLMQDPSGNPNIVYMAGKYLTTSGSHILKLTESSGTITASEVPYDFYAASTGGYVSAIAFSPLNPNYWFTTTDNGHFFWSADAGVTWNETSSFTGPPPHYFYGSAIYASHIQSGTIYIGGSGYSNPPVYKSTDNGQTFAPMSNGLPSTLVYQITGDDMENYLFAATDAGPYEFSTADGMWYNMENSTAPEQVYWSVEFMSENQTVRFGTYGRGIWDFKINQSPNGIPEMVTDNSISIFPNPNSGKFKISGNSGISSVEIYNLPGQLIYSDFTFSKQTTKEINLVNPCTGIYLLKIYSGGKSYNRKFVVQ